MTDFERAVLSAVTLYCTGNSGFVTGHIASLVGRQPGRDSNRKHSVAVSEALHTLEVLGHVRRLDKGSPIVWCRGAA